MSAEAWILFAQFILSISGAIYGYGRLSQKVDDVREILTGERGLVARVERLEQQHAQSFSATSGR